MGSIYPVILGLAPARQAVLDIMIFRSRVRLKKTKDRSFPSSDQPYALKEAAPARTPNVAVDIRPLCHSLDIECMKPQGIDLSSCNDNVRDLIGCESNFANRD